MAGSRVGGLRHPFDVAIRLGDRRGYRKRSPSGGAHLGRFGRFGRLGRPRDEAHRLDAARIGVEDLDFPARQIVGGDHFATHRNSAEGGKQQAAERVDVLVVVGE